MTTGGGACFAPLRLPPVLVVCLHVIVGALLATLALTVDLATGEPFDLGFLQWATLGSAFAVTAAGIALRRCRVGQTTTRLCLACLAALLALGGAEATFRVLDWDFAHEREEFENVAIYYRQPLTATGSVFFKRKGNERWRGRIRFDELQRLGISPNPYGDEPEIAVTYDSDGFRNPKQLDDWVIAVAGDSFTELGYIPQEQLFTSVLAQETGLSVRNLGTVMTGPLTHLHYLQEFGVSPSTKHWVQVFFEGNDLDDLRREAGDLQRYQATGERPRRELHRRNSLLWYLRELRRLQFYSPPRSRVDNAVFAGGAGPIPVTVQYAPPGSEELDSAVRAMLVAFLHDLAAAARARDIEPWLAYMPCKLRVHYAGLTVHESARPSLRNWRPNDLPQFLEELCRESGIHFIDLTPVLTRHARDFGELVYNSVHDTHIDERGTRIVGEVIAQRFREYLASTANGQDR